MTSRAGLLGVQPDEGRSAGLMVLHSFFMGLSTVFFETAASALFLSSFEARYIPWVYVAAAVVNTLTGLGYAALRQRVSFAVLMTGTLGFLFAGVFGFRLAIALTSAAWLAFGLLVFYRVISILTDLEYWAVAARLYNVRQAKRLFGLIGTGEVVARIAGAFAVPFLVRLLGGVEGLLVLSAGGLFGCILVLVPILRIIPPAPAEEVRPPREDEPTRSAFDHLRLLLKDRYVVTMLGMVAIGVLGKYFVDFAFLEQMRTRYQDKAALAGFFGYFSGITQALSLLTRAFLSGRILNRYGVATGLLVLPIAHAVCSFLIVGAGVLFGSADAVFWLSMLNQGIYKTLKHPIDNPSIKVLYQPLRRDQRLSTQIAVEAIVTPIAIGVAGAVMLLFSAVLPFDPVQFAGAMFVSFVAWAAFARVGSREYFRSLLRALRGRLVDHPSFTLFDEPSLALIRDKLASADPGDVIFALDLLERVDAPGRDETLLARLRHPSPEVVKYVLGRLEHLHPEGGAAAVSAALQSSTQPAVRAAALRCLAALEGATGASTVEPWLDDADPAVRRGAITGLLRHGSPAHRDRAQRELLALAADGDPEVRQAAAFMAAEAGGQVAEDVLLRLLTDSVTDVRRNAFVAAGRTDSRAVWRLVMDSLASPRYGAGARAALVAVGAPVVPDVATRFAEEERRLPLYYLAAILGRIGGPAAAAALRRRIEHPSEVVRTKVLEELAHCEWRATGDDTAVVLRQIREEAEDAAWICAAIEDLRSEPALAGVVSALEGELLFDRRRVLDLLSFLYDPKAIRRARANLSHESRERRAYALEVIDLSIPRELRGTVVPILDEIPAGQRLAQLAEDFPQPRLGRDARLVALVTRPLRWLRPFTRAAIIHGAARVGCPGLPAALESCPDPDPLVRETAEWALTGASGGPSMLTIEKVMILRGAPIFAKTPEEVLEDIARILEEVEIRKGEVVFERGAPGDSMYIIIDGKVRVYDGDKTINVLGAREIFGELALLDPEPRSASIAALEDTRLFRIDRETFTELMAGSISIVRGILHVLCERLRRLIPLSRPYEGPEVPAPGRK